MKIISLEIKKITLGRFFPREDKIELNIFFNDGTDKEIFRMVDTSEPEDAAEEIIADLRKMEKKIHADGKKEESLLGETINIVTKDEDKVLRAIANFIAHAKSKVDKIRSKNDEVGYLDMVRELQSLKLEF